MSKMQITKETRYVVDGREFKTLDKAQDYVNGLVDKVLQPQFFDKGFSANETFKISQVILDNRDILLTLLGCKFEDESSNQDYYTDGVEE